MRAAVLAASLLVPLTASAGPFHDVVMQPPRHATTTKAFTHVSNTIYLNPCLPNGCTVRPGRDDSRTDTSSIPDTQAVLTAYPHGSESWNSLVQCVKDMYAPFAINVTDVDPGTEPHFEVMVAGNAHAVGQDGAGGVAPFIPCDGQLEDNVISFVFAAQTDNLDFLCWAAAQESSHVFGLDHELNAKDPMTYLTPPIKKPGFQNAAASCGEDAGQPRDCWCGGATQNSYQYLMDTFGPAQLDPASIAITSPADGAWVKPGFSVKAELTSQLSAMTGALAVDGSTTQSIRQGDPLVFSAPSSLAGGDHTISVTTTDSATRTLSAEITVHVTDRCDGGRSCASGFACLGGLCLPNASTPGGLGATCTGNDDCITGRCANDGTATLCTDYCDSGDSCPSGYECISAGAQSVCWPGSSSGCSTSNSEHSPLLVLFGLGMLGLILRRRR